MSGGIFFVIELSSISSRKLRKKTMADYEINFMIPSPRKHKYKGIEYTLWKVEDSSREAFQHMVYVLRPNNDRPILRHFGRKKKKYNTSRNEWKKEMKKCFPLRTESNEIKCSERHSALYWYLRVLWKNKWGIRSMDIGDDTYKIASRRVSNK